MPITLDDMRKYPCRAGALQVNAAMSLDLLRRCLAALPPRANSYDRDILRRDIQQRIEGLNDILTLIVQADGDGGSR